VLPGREREGAFLNELLNRVRAGHMIRAQIAYSQNRGSDAPALLLRAARRLEPLDLRMARQTYLDAVLAGHFAGRLAPGSLREAAAAARRVPPVTGPAAASDLLLDGLATASAVTPRRSPRPRPPTPSKTRESPSSRKAWPNSSRRRPAPERPNVPRAPWRAWRR
jgi:hypothetical protein